MFVGANSIIAIKFLPDCLLGKNDIAIRNYICLFFDNPKIESFTLSNFKENSFCEKFATRDSLKTYLHKKCINHQNITEQTLVTAEKELFKAFPQCFINYRCIP